MVEQENRNNLGGQAFWSLGGLFFVDSPEQRRMGIKDLATNLDSQVMRPDSTPLPGLYAAGVGRLRIPALGTAAPA